MPVSLVFGQMHVGKWYCIEAHAPLNDPGRANGVFELWINGGLEARIDSFAVSTQRIGG